MDMMPTNAQVITMEDDDELEVKMAKRAFNLSGECDELLAELAWKRRTTVSQILRDLVAEYLSREAIRKELNIP
jgi:hypothetical protein